MNDFDFLTDGPKILIEFMVKHYWSPRHHLTHGMASGSLIGPREDVAYYNAPLPHPCIGKTDLCSNRELHLPFFA
ncbi:predicted protein [Botrytis cinerea T4]|uniref:Uncharacterized protein n=1 Tax=Botryotinia fuckeliana (strain T4) TaxID=999810 RepID=G2YS55_BOTF4|nr:predicted protein [Botrytis cinerea T4]